MASVDRTATSYPASMKEFKYVETHGSGPSFTKQVKSIGNELAKKNKDVSGSDLFNYDDDALIYKRQELEIQLSKHEKNKPNTKTRAGICAEFWTVSHMAEYYGCSVEDIQKANPEVNFNNMDWGDQVVIPYNKKDPKYIKWDKERSALQRKIWDVDMGIELHRTALATERTVKKAKNEYNDKYDFKVAVKNGTVYVYVKLKAGAELGDVADDLIQKEGVLRASTADILAKYKPEPSGWFVKTVDWDEAEIPKGVILAIPAEDFNPDL